MDLSLADDVATLIDEIASGASLPDNITSVQVVNSLPNNPVSGTAYVVNGNLNIDKNFTFQDGLLAVRGELVIGQNGAIINSYGDCSNGEPGVGVMATKKVHLNQNSNVDGAQIIAGGDFQIEQNANFKGSAVAKGDAKLQQTPVLSQCENIIGEGTGAFADAQMVE